MKYHFCAWQQYYKFFALYLTSVGILLILKYVRLVIPFEHDVLVSTFNSFSSRSFTMDIDMLDEFW